jgi:hypothetical protein
MVAGCTAKAVGTCRGGHDACPLTRKDCASHEYRRNAARSVRHVFGATYRHTRVCLGRRCRKAGGNVSIDKIGRPLFTFTPSWGHPMSGDHSAVSAPSDEAPRLVIADVPGLRRARGSFSRRRRCILPRSSSCRTLGCGLPSAARRISRYASLHHVLDRRTRRGVVELLPLLRGRRQDLR